LFIGYAAHRVVQDALDLIFDGAPKESTYKARALASDGIAYVSATVNLEVYVVQIDVHIPNINRELFGGRGAVNSERDRHCAYDIRTSRLGGSVFKDLDVAVYGADEGAVVEIQALVDADRELDLKAVIGDGANLAVFQNESNLTARLAARTRTIHAYVGVSRRVWRNAKVQTVD
jgi:hypothetical protein